MRHAARMRGRVKSMPTLELTRALPGGCTVTFKLSPDRRRMDCYWTPSTPKPKHWRREKFRQAYFAARREFSEMVADQIGGTVLTLTPEGNTLSVEAVRPPVRQ